MESPIKALQKLQSMRRARLEKSARTVENMKRVYDEAAKLSQEVQKAKE